MVSTFYSNGNTVKFRIKDVHIMGDGCALLPYPVHCKCAKKKVFVEMVKFQTLCRPPLQCVDHLKMSDEIFFNTSEMTIRRGVFWNQKIPKIMTPKGFSTQNRGTRVHFFL